jgi:hypothetical protein
MTKREMIRELKGIEETSDNQEVCLKSPGGGQWTELVLRRATDEEKQNAGITPDKWVAVIAADGDKKLAAYETGVSRLWFSHDKR